ncbi:MAG: adenylate/guanylate cyclase domain-containing protein [Candidatus Promineifilaceae bacterium]|nr:adenylate/guanylate cyclase domain-containing protein [Candidatus Promineifilaceae bacterium]
MSNRASQARPMPTTLAAKLKAIRARQQLSGERRVITMLFCDVTGSTSIAEQLDPEAWAAIMDEAWDYLIGPVYRYEGTLAHMMGDGMLAFFGAPIAHEDDPRRAVLAGLDILRELRPFAETVEEAFGFAFQVRVGIHTGPVVVGDIGSDLHVSYTAMGDAVNLAARMEQTASPDTIQISAATYRLVAPLFETEALGEIQVKGRVEPVEAYRVIAVKEQPGLLRGIDGLETPLVGRAAEFEQLLRAVEALRRGQGGVVLLLGEAGLGKSRLVEELRAAWLQSDGDPEAWTVSQGIAYERDRAYGLFSQRMRRVLGIGPEDAGELVRAKIEAKLDDAPAEQRRRLQRSVEALLAMESESDRPEHEAEALKRELFATTRTTWREAAREQPMVAVFDDLHWADAASMELLGHLLPLAAEVPLLLVGALRPDKRSAGWQLRQTATELAAGPPSAGPLAGRYEEIALAPLSADDSDRVIGELLVLAQVPSETRRLILAKAEGNPLFVEELVRELIEREVLIREPEQSRWRLTRPVEQLEIPDTLQALLTSRIDRLGKESKRVLQLAAVIGRTFSEQTLTLVVGDALGLAAENGELGVHLQALQQAGLVRPAADETDRHYRFRHELLRDAAYSTILRSRRPDFHRWVGQALEGLFPDRLGAEAHRLVYHFSEAGDDQRALTYGRLAGDVAAGVYALDEAVGHYRRALPLVRELGDPEQIGRLYTKLGRTLELGGRHDEAFSHYAELQALGQARQQPHLLLTGLVAEATLRATQIDQYDDQRAEALAQEALALARELKEVGAEARIHWVLLLLYSSIPDRLAEAVAQGERSLALARRHELLDQEAYTLHDLARALSRLGRLDQAVEYREQATQLFRHLDDKAMVIDNLNRQAAERFMLGDVSKAHVLALEGLRLSQAIDSVWGQGDSLGRLSRSYLEQGRLDEALDSWQRSDRCAREVGFTGRIRYVPAMMAFIYLSVGGLAQAQKRLTNIERRVGQVELAAVRQVFDYGRAFVHLQQGELDRAIALTNRELPDLFAMGIDPLLYSMVLEAAHRVRLARGRAEAALRQAKACTDSARGAKVRVILPTLRRLQAEALMALGRLKEARVHLQRAQQEAAAMPSVRQGWPISAARVRLEHQAGYEQAAAAAQRRGRPLVTVVADHIGSAALRQSFLDLADVRLLMECR